MTDHHEDFRLGVLAGDDDEVLDGHAKYCVDCASFAASIKEIDEAAYDFVVGARMPPALVKRIVGGVLREQRAHHPGQRLDDGSLLRIVRPIVDKLRVRLIPVCVALAVLGCVALIVIQHAVHPSGSPKSAEQAQHLSASMWQPWVTAAENVAIISILAAVPIAVVLGSCAALRAIEAHWPKTAAPDRNRSNARSVYLDPTIKPTSGPTWDEYSGAGPAGQETAYIPPKMHAGPRSGG
jgi:hypothetical protein